MRSHTQCWLDQNLVSCFLLLWIISVFQKDFRKLLPWYCLLCKKKKKKSKQGRKKEKKQTGKRCSFANTSHWESLLWLNSHLLNGTVLGWRNTNTKRANKNLCLQGSFVQRERSNSIWKLRHKRQEWDPNILQNQFYLPTDFQSKPFIIIRLRFNHIYSTVQFQFETSTLSGPVSIHYYIYLFLTTCKWDVNHIHVRFTEKGNETCINKLRQAK